MSNREVEKVKESLANGPYAWPGGYPLYFIAADGEALSFDAVNANLELVLEATGNPGTDKHWEIIACEINWDDEDLYCAHTNKKIECAYPKDESED